MLFLVQTTTIVLRIGSSTNSKLFGKETDSVVRPTVQCVLQVDKIRLSLSLSRMEIVLLQAIHQSNLPYPTIYHTRESIDKMWWWDVCAMWCLSVLWFAPLVVCVKRMEVALPHHIKRITIGTFYI